MLHTPDEERGSNFDTTLKLELSQEEENLEDVGVPSPLPSDIYKEIFTFSQCANVALILSTMFYWTGWVPKLIPIRKSI